MSVYRYIRIYLAVYGPETKAVSVLRKERKWFVVKEEQSTSMAVCSICDPPIIDHL